MSPELMNSLSTSALRIIKQAGDMALHQFGRRHTLTIDSKGHHDWVSEADRVVEYYIRDALRQAFPHHALLGEETGGALNYPCWVVDPIDGTTNFLYGQADFVISMALIDETGPVIGLIYAPVHRRLFVAIKGAGAWEETPDQRVMLTPRPAARDQLVVGLNLNYHPGVPAQYLVHSQWLIQYGHQIRVSGSAAWTLVQVATGELDGCYLGDVNIWDVMAAQLICQQAGLAISPYLIAPMHGAAWAWPRQSPLNAWIAHPHSH